MQQNSLSEKDEKPEDARRAEDRHTNIVGGIIFALLGAYIFWEAQRFDEYGAVTPMFVGVGLIVLSLALIVSSLTLPKLIPPIERPTGSLKTRGILVILMIVWVTVLPYAGFMLSSIIAFALIAGFVPVQTRWTGRGIVLHAIGAVTVTVLFWFILTTYLNVPLPAASFL